MRYGKLDWSNMGILDKVRSETPRPNFRHLKFGSVFRSGLKPVRFIVEFIPTRIARLCLFVVSDYLLYLIK